MIQSSNTWPVTGLIRFLSVFAFRSVNFCIVLYTKRLVAQYFVFQMRIPRICLSINLQFDKQIYIVILQVLEHHIHMTDQRLKNQQFNYIHINHHEATIMILQQA